MMATKPKAASTSEETKPSVLVVEPEKKEETLIPETTQEREDALKERLAALGNEEKAKEEVVEDLLLMETVNEKPTPPPPPAAKLEKKASTKDTKTALLARIMAAQERAKQAQQKKVEAAEVTTVETTTTATKSEETNAKQKMLEALSSKPKSEDKPINTFDPLAPMAPPVMAPPAYEPPKTTPPPTFQPPTTAPPPASMAPPSFDALEQFNVTTKAAAPLPPPTAPSAPVFEEPPAMTRLDSSEHLTGVVPLAPMAAFPQQQDPMAPPSFADYEQQRQPPAMPDFMQKLKNAGVDEEQLDMAALDIDGMPMSSEERRKMMEEQRAIMEQIQKEKQANDAAIAAAKAENFEDRANGAAASQQRAPTSVARAAVMTESGEVESNLSEDAERTRTVDIGGGQRVALQGQERTKAAIASGTAILVQCMNCQNWMQVTDSATLMFCPVCQTVSPVIKQSEINTKDEAIQLMKDRQLAEQLQNMEYEENDNGRSRKARAKQQNTADEEKKDTATISDWLYSFVGNKPAETAAAGSTATFDERFASQKEKKTWWDSISSVVNVGVPNEAKSAEIRVQKPPGAVTSKPTGLQQAQTGHEEDRVDYVPEHETLLGANSSKRNLQPARVAESNANPFSCVVDTVSSIGTTLTTRPITEDRNGNVHGINASPLLAVPNVGRNSQNNSSSGGYQRVSGGP